MTNSPAAQRRGTIAVAVAAAVWVLAVLISMLRWLSAGMDIWADQGSADDPHSIELGQRGVGATVVLAMVVVGGPVLIAVVAFLARMAWTGAFFLVMAAAFGALALLMSNGGSLPSRPPPAEPQPTHSICQERSGGDTRCPGG